MHRQQTLLSRERFPLFCAFKSKKTREIRACTFVVVWSDMSLRKGRILLQIMLLHLRSSAIQAPKFWCMDCFAQRHALGVPYMPSSLFLYLDLRQQKFITARYPLSFYTPIVWYTASFLPIKQIKASLYLLNLYVRANI